VVQWSFTVRGPLAHGSLPAKFQRDIVAGPSSNGKTPDLGNGPTRAGPLSCAQFLSPGAASVTFRRA